MQIFNTKKVAEKKYQERRCELLDSIAREKKKIEKLLLKVGKEDWTLMNRYMFIEREDFDYEGKRKGRSSKDTWVDFIEIYRGAFSLYKPALRFRWEFVDRKYSLNANDFEQTMKHYPFPGTNNILKFNNISLERLKEKLEGLHLTIRNLVSPRPETKVSRNRSHGILMA